MDPTHAKIARSSVRWLIGLVVCANGMAYAVNRYMLVPVQDQLTDWYDIGAVEYNLLMTLYSWPNMILSILCGILIDKIGSRTVIIVSWLLDLAGLAVIIYSCPIRNYLFLCIGRTIVGIGNEALSMSIKIYAIQFFHTNEYGVVFGIYLAFMSLGGGFNTFVSYRMYAWTDNLLWSLLLPVFVAAIVCVPLFVLMIMERTGLLSQLIGADNSDMETDETQLISDAQSVSVRERNKFRVSDIQKFSVFYWILLIGFVIGCGASQSTLNIGISFIHHMFGYSYEFATWIALFGTVIGIVTYLISGIGTAKIGRKMEFLLIANIAGMCGTFIYGWVNTHVFWAIVGQIGQRTLQGFTYPVVWAAIPLLVEEKARGTAFGFATSIRFGTIAICYVFVGLLTKNEDGNRKYIDVQMFILALEGVSTVFYVLLYYLDVKYNGSALKNPHAKKEQAIPAGRKEGDLSMAKISFASN